MAEFPASMAAVRFERLGSPDVLTVARVPTPTPGRGQVLVRVMAAGVNPVDVVARAEQLAFIPPYQFPVYPGWDVAGEVVALGENPGGWVLGDEVFGLAGFPAPTGTHAEYVAVAAGRLDLVLNCTGPEAAARAVAAIAPGGFLVSIRGGVTEEVAAAAEARGVGHANILVHPDGAGMAELAALVRQGALRTRVSASYPLRDVAKAHRQVESRHTVGKITLVPDA